MIVAALDDDNDSYTDTSRMPTGDRYSGVRALWLKVIIRAIFDWVTYRDSDKLMQKKLAENAHSWLFDESELFNGFENVCVYLDVDPDHIRNRARKMSKEDVAKIEHLERSAETEEKVVRIRASVVMPENHRLLSAGEWDEEVA